MPRPPTTRRPRRPRQTGARRIVKLRIQADSEADCLAACAQVAAALRGCTMRRPQPGRNPRYEGRQQWLSYGELELDAQR
jgi:hypothetical protein